MMQTYNAQQYESRQETLHGWSVGVTTYRVGDTFHCRVDNVSPGAIIARARGASKDEAEQKALASADVKLSQTVRRTD